MYKHIIKQFEHALGLKYLSIILSTTLDSFGHGTRKGCESRNNEREKKRKNKKEAHAPKKHASVPARKKRQISYP
jgi:hypothetical protein